jgi:hypothetical protein
MHWAEGTMPTRMGLPVGHLLCRTGCLPLPHGARREAGQTQRRPGSACMPCHAVWKQAATGYRVGRDPRQRVRGSRAGCDALDDPRGAAEEPRSSKHRGRGAGVGLPAGVGVGRRVRWWEALLEDVVRATGRECVQPRRYVPNGPMVLRAEALRVRCGAARRGAHEYAHLQHVCRHRQHVDRTTRHAGTAVGNAVGTAVGLEVTTRRV